MTTYISCRYCRKRLSVLSKNKYCSTNCEIGASRHTKEKRKCENCGDEFVTYKRYGKKYCSFKCVYSHPAWREKQRQQTHSFETKLLLGEQSKQRNVGTGNGRYTHGLNTLRRLVQEEANGVCRLCGITVGVVKGFLDIHHVNMNHHDNSPKNLLAVCPNCHRIAHLKEKKKL